MRRVDFLESAIDTAEEEGVLVFERLTFRLRKSDANALKLIRYAVRNSGSAKMSCFLEALYLALCHELRKGKSECERSATEELTKEILQFLKDLEVSSTIDTIRDTLIWLIILSGRAKKVTVSPSLDSYSEGDK